MIPVLSYAQIRSIAERAWMDLRVLETHKRHDTTTVEMVQTRAPFVRVNLVLEVRRLISRRERLVHSLIQHFE